MSAGAKRKTLGEKALSLALDGVIRVVLGTIDTVKLIKKMRRRYQHQARRKR